MIELNDFYSGGFFLLRRSHPGGSSLDSPLLPATLISLSDCLSRRFNIVWGWTPGNRQAALDFGIPETQLNACLKWCEADYQADMDLFSMFYSVEAARRFINRFQVSTDNLYLIEAGLPSQFEATDWRPFYNEQEDFGIEKRIHHRLPMAGGGEPLGFEVVGYEYNDLSHSWLCSGLHQDMFDLFQIHPNQYGLIETLEEAVKVYRWIREDEMKGTRAEPIAYDVWLLVSYPLE